MSLSIEILIAIAAVAVTYIIYKRMRTYSKTPPSLPWLPIVGSLPFLSEMSTMHLFLTEKSKHYGSVFSFYAGSKYTVVLNGNDAIQEALVKRSADFAGRDKVYAEQLVWNPELRGLAFRQYGEDFKTIRKMCVTILKKLGMGDRNTMEAKIQEEIIDCIDYIREKNGRAFDMHDILRTFALSIVFNLMFGKRLKVDDPKAQYIRDWINVYEQSLDPVLDLFSLSRYLPKFRQILKNIIPESKKYQEFINEQLEQCQTSSANEENFANEFLKNVGVNIDRSELGFIVKDFISGFETATQILWSVLLLCNNPSIQERLHQEVDTVVPKDRLPSISDKLPYLEATLLEVMRRNIAVPLALPHTTLCDTEVAGFFIPANTQVVVNLWSVHMDPNVWTNPQEFHPERFLNDDGEVINRDRLVGFSLGKRRCPGEILGRQEVFLNLAALLQNFDFLPPEGQTSIPDHGTASLLYVPDRFDVRLLPRAS